MPVATTGRPQAIASRGIKPKGSAHSLGNTTASAAQIAGSQRVARDCVDAHSLIHAEGMRRAAVASATYLLLAGPQKLETVVRRQECERSDGGLHALPRLDPADEEQPTSPGPGLFARGGRRKVASVEPQVGHGRAVERPTGIELGRLASGFAAEADRIDPAQVCHGSRHAGQPADEAAERRAAGRSRAHGSTRGP